MQTHIEIYTKPDCPKCAIAKQRLKTLGAIYVDFDISENTSLHEEMISRSHGSTTVPQIFFDDTHIGGSDDLARMHESGELDHWFNVPVHEMHCSETHDQLVCF